MVLLKYSDINLLAHMYFWRSMESPVKVLQLHHESPSSHNWSRHGGSLKNLLCAKNTKLVQWHLWSMAPFSYITGESTTPCTLRWVNSVNQEANLVKQLFLIWTCHWWQLLMLASGGIHPMLPGPDIPLAHFFKNVPSVYFFFQTENVPQTYAASI